jgi:hypothetical protein
MEGIHKEANKMEKNVGKRLMWSNGRVCPEAVAGMRWASLLVTLPKMFTCGLSKVPTTYS